MMPQTSLSFGLVALLLTGAPRVADTITKTDGSVLADVKIESETLKEVTYREGRNAQTIPAAEVLSITFSETPTSVDEALAFLQEGDLGSAVGFLDTYVDAQIAKPNESKRFGWAPAYAASKALEIRMQVIDLRGAVSAAKRLIDHYPQSRYLPTAYLQKANAEAWMGQNDAALATLESMAELVSSQELSKRWDLECRLARIRVDKAKVGAGQRTELAAVGSEAGSAFPTVRGRARVAEGESYIAEAERTNDTSKAKDLRGKAQRVFEEIAQDASADAETLAGAYSGLGDCLFFAGAAADDKNVLKQAAMHYLRVVVNHQEQGQYVPKALFYGMRCFDLMGERQRRNDLRRELLALYPGTTWASRPEVK